MGNDIEGGRGLNYESDGEREMVTLFLGEDKGTMRVCGPSIMHLLQVVGTRGWRDREERRVVVQEVYGAPEVLSYTFNDKGQVTSFTGGYVVDRRVGNTDGLGALPSCCSWLSRLETDLKLRVWLANLLVHPIFH